MARIVLLVTLKAKTGMRDELLAQLKQHAQRTLARERGCMQFDIMLPLETENEVRLVEIYLSEEALEQHRGSTHLAQFREDTAELVTGREIVECELQVDRR